MAFSEGNRHKMKHWKFMLDVNAFHCEGGQALEQAAQRGYDSPSVAQLTWSSATWFNMTSFEQALAQMTSRGPFQLNYCVILWILPAAHYGSQPEKYHYTVDFIYFSPRISKRKFQWRKQKLMLQQQCYYTPLATNTMCNHSVCGHIG